MRNCRKRDLGQRISQLASFYFVVCYVTSCHVVVVLFSCFPVFAFAKVSAEVAFPHSLSDSNRLF